MDELRKTIVQRIFLSLGIHGTVTVLLFRSLNERDELSEGVD